MNRFSMLAMSITGAALLAGPLLAAQAPQQTADRLLSQMKSEAQNVQMHANQLERLAKETNAKWAEFDQQWNEIKPAQEDLQVRLNRLESMRASLNDSQQKELDGCKTAVEQISSRTRELLKMMDQPQADLTSHQFRVDAQDLVKDAQTVAHTA